VQEADAVEMEEWLGDATIFRSERASGVQVMDLEPPPEQATMEDRLLESLNADGVSREFLELHGPGLAAVLMPNYQAILAYFRHKKLLTERSKQYERMRRAVAVLGEQDSVNELARGKANGGDDLDSRAAPLLRRGRKRTNGATMLAALTEKESDSGQTPNERCSRIQSRHLRRQV